MTYFPTSSAPPNPAGCTQSITYVWCFRLEFPDTVSAQSQSATWTPFDPSNQPTIEHCFIDDRGRDVGIHICDSHFNDVIVVYPRDGWLRWRDREGKAYVKYFDVNGGRREKGRVEEMELGREGRIGDMREVEMDETREGWEQWGKSNMNIVEKPWWLGIMLVYSYFIRAIF